MRTTLFTLFYLFSLSFSFSQWKTITPYPAGVQDGAFAVTLDDKAYIGGGLLGNDFFEYDPVTDHYRRLADVPSPGDHLAWAFAFGIGQHIYVAGGSYETATDLAEELWDYDIDTDTWTQKAPYPGGPRDGGFAFTLQGKGYAGGGFDGVDFRDDVYAYDPQTDSWEQKDNYPDGGIIFPSFFIIDDEAYVGLGADFSEKRTLFSYDPDADAWTEKSSYPGPFRQANFFFSYKNTGYVGGGMVGYASHYEDFWEYDATNDSWSESSIGDIPTINTSWGVTFTYQNNFYVGLGVHMPSFANNRFIYTHAIDDPALGIDDHEKAQYIDVFPNPNNGSFQLAVKNLNSTDLQTMKLTNALGQQIDFNAMIKGNNVSINVDLPSPTGLYFLRFVKDNKPLKSKVFIRP